MGNVCAEALTVEYSKGKTYSRVATRQMFALAGCVPLFCMVSTGLSHEDPITAEAIEVTSSARKFASKIWEVLSSKSDGSKVGLKKGDGDAGAAGENSWSVGQVC